MHLSIITIVAFVMILPLSTASAQIEKNSTNSIQPTPNIQMNITIENSTYPALQAPNPLTLSPLKQFESGIAAKDVQCKENLQLVIKAEDGSPACVRSQTASVLIQRGWATTLSANLLALKEGQREGPLLVEKILSDSVSGLNFIEYPLAIMNGMPITLHIGESASNGCTESLTLVKIENNTAFFTKKTDFNRPCPICLSGGTLIFTPAGQNNVKDLKVGMQVWTQDKLGHKQLAKILETGKALVPPNHIMVHLILDDGRKILASPGHPTADGRFFGDLAKGDALDNSRIKSIDHVVYNETYTYDILPSGPTGFYWANGILVGSTLR